jgi:hypothetical protein
MIDAFVKNEEQRQVLKLIFSPVDLGQPYLAPPGVSQERVIAPIREIRTKYGLPQLSGKK